MIKGDGEVVEKPPSSQDSRYRELFAEAGPDFDDVRSNVQANVVEERRSLPRTDNSAEGRFNSIFNADTDGLPDARVEETIWRTRVHPSFESTGWRRVLR